MFLGASVSRRGSAWWRTREGDSSSATLTRCMGATWRTPWSCGSRKSRARAASPPFGSTSVGSVARRAATLKGSGNRTISAPRSPCSGLVCRTGGPLGVAGYSFGAWVAAQVAGSGATVAALCLIAPPLAMLDFGSLDGVGPDVLLASGTRDPYCPPPSLAALAERLPGAAIETVDGADHFFFGKLFPLGEAVRNWTRRWTRG